MLCKALVICLVLYASASFGETFKCSKPGGASYYSDTPCGNDKTVRVEQTLATSAGGQVNQKLLVKMNELCKSAVKDWLPYKDPASLVYRENTRLSGKNVTIKGGKSGPQAAIRINLDVTSRTSSSRYNSSETYYCYVTPSDMPSVIGIYTQPME